MRTPLRTMAILASLTAAVACKPAASSTQPALAGLELPEPSDLTYGIYLNGAKVGWMRSMVRVGDRVEMGIELHASVAGMGRVSQIELEEHRTYGGPDGRLTALSFSQEAATGAVRIRGERQGEELVVSITAGNATQTQRFAVRETLQDALAAQRLAKSGKVGATAASQHFDPSLQKTLEVQHTLAAAGDKMLAGVPTRTMRIESTYGDLGVTETSWLDAAGKVLETQVGGFFVARLEPPEVARRLDYQNDLLANAAVKTPRPISDPEDLDRLQVTFTGFGDLSPPSSDRQKVVRRGETILLTLARDPSLPDLPLADLDVPTAVRAELAATPFIQTDAGPIWAAAARAAAGGKLVSEVVPRLSAFVYEHVRDEYVPAYSNALEALQSGRGDCTEHSVLFVALARALGLPARVAVGIAYWPPGGGFGWHAWTEVYAGGRWYAVDPTWNQPIADATHIKLASGGPAEQARIVMLLGRLRVIGMEM